MERSGVRTVIVQIILKKLIFYMLFKDCGKMATTTTVHVRDPSGVIKTYEISQEQLALSKKLAANVSNGVVELEMSHRVFDMVYQYMQNYIKYPGQNKYPPRPVWKKKSLKPCFDPETYGMLLRCDVELDNSQYCKVPINEQVQLVVDVMRLTNAARDLQMNLLLHQCCARYAVFFQEATISALDEIMHQPIIAIEFGTFEENEIPGSQLG